MTITVIVPPRDPDITALENLTVTGLLTRASEGVFYGRTITGSTGLTVADGSGVAGNPTLTLDSDLVALASNTSNGLWARTETGTGSARTITGTASQIGVTNGDGVSGNPVLALLGNALALSGLTGAADKLAYFTGEAAMAVTNLVSQARSFLADPSSAFVNFLQSGTGAVATTAQAKLRLIKAAEDFGAVGDGTTENVTLIQAGLDALSAAGGGFLTLGEGTFKATGNLIMPSNVGLYGVGRTATILNISGRVRAADITFGGTRTYRTSIKNLSIVNTTGGAGSVALDLSNMSLAEVDEVEISGAETCLYMAGYAFYNSIKSVRAMTNGQGTGQTGFKIRGGVRALLMESISHNGDAGQIGLDIASDVNSGVNDITVVNPRLENGDVAAGTAYTGVELYGYSAGNNLQAVRLYGGGVDAALLAGSKAVVQTGYVSSCGWDGNPFWSLPSGSTYFDLSDTSSFQVGSTDFQSYYGGAFRIRLANTAGTFGQVPSYSAQIYADTSAGNHRIFFRNQVDTGWSDLYAGRIEAATALVAGTTLTTGGNATIGGAVNATDEVTTTVGYYKSGLLVVGPRKTGWDNDTGTAKRTANATYSGTAGATYDQTVMQTLMDAVRDYTQTMKALKDDIHATTGNHGLIGN